MLVGEASIGRTQEVDGSTKLGFDFHAIIFHEVTNHNSIPSSILTHFVTFR